MNSDNFAKELDESLMRCYQNLDFVELRHLDINPASIDQNSIAVAGNRKIR